MKKRVSMILTAVLTVCFLLAHPLQVLAAEACQHLNVVPEVTKEATVKKRGTVIAKCNDCGCYRSKNSSGIFWQPVAGNKYVISYDYYKPFTLSYKSTLNGSESTLPGNFRIVSVSNDYYGSEGLTKTYPGLPATPVPTGYKVTGYSTTAYAVLVNGKPSDSYVPGNSVQMVESWMNDTDTNYVVVPIYLIEEPKVSITQKGMELTANIANANDNLEYTYQWSKDGTPITGATTQTLKLEDVGGGTAYSVTVTANSKVNSVIATVRDRDSSASSATAAITPEETLTVTFDSNGGSEVSPAEIIKGKPYGALPGAGYIDGTQNLGWYVKNSDGTLGDTQVKKTDIVNESHTLFQKRELKVPSVTIKRDRNPYNYTGEPVTLTADLTTYDTISYGYQWYKDGRLIDGATKQSLTLKGEVADSGTYTVIVTIKLAEGIKAQMVNPITQAEVTDKPLTIRRTNNQLILDMNRGDGETWNDFDYMKDGKYVVKVNAGLNPTRENYVFCGWNTKEDGSGDNYKGGDFYVFEDPSGNGGLRTTLYANWKEDKNGNGIPDVDEIVDPEPPVPTVTPEPEDPKPPVPSVTPEPEDPKPPVPTVTPKPEDPKPPVPTVTPKPTQTPDATKDKNVATNDRTDFGIWVALMTVSCAGIAGIVIYDRKRKIMK